MKLFGALMALLSLSALVDVASAEDKHCQVHRMCASDDPPNFYEENKDYVTLSDTVNDCNECRKLCAAKTGCTGAYDP